MVDPHPTTQPMRQNLCLVLDALAGGRSFTADNLSSNPRPAAPYWWFGCCR
jgi:hypothetical protein